MNSHIEVRKFTLACELVCTGVGVWVVSELDAVKYQKLDLVFRPFTPSLPHGLFLVRPILKNPPWSHWNLWSILEAALFPLA